MSSELCVSGGAFESAFNFKIMLNIRWIIKWNGAETGANYTKIYHKFSYNTFKLNS